MTSNKILSNKRKYYNNQIKATSRDRKNNKKQKRAEIKQEQQHKNTKTFKKIQITIKIIIDYQILMNI